MAQLHHILICLLEVADLVAAERNLNDATPAIINIESSERHGVEADGVTTKIVVNGSLVPVVEDSAHKAVAPSVAKETAIAQAPIATSVDRDTPISQAPESVPPAWAPWPNQSNSIWSARIQCYVDRNDRVSYAKIAAQTLCFSLGVLLFIKCVRSTSSKDLRFIFHATRVAPWGAFIILDFTIIAMDTSAFFSNDHDACVQPAHIVLGLALCGLLLNDLMWLGLFFHELHLKPFLTVHHAVYLAQMALLCSGHMQYVRLMIALAGLEESQEVVASLSYLHKKTSNGTVWLLFRSVFRTICSGFAIGVYATFIVVGFMTLSTSMLAFMVVDICLWLVFMAQEWHHIRSLLEETRQVHFELPPKVQYCCANSSSVELAYEDINASVGCAYARSEWSRSLELEVGSMVRVTHEGHVDL